MSLTTFQESLLAELVRVGHQPSIDFAYSLVAAASTTTTVVTGNVTAASTVQTPPPVEQGADIGHETDATTLDKRGFPWDSRIHAKTKTQNKDGTWKYAVGVDKEVLVPNVEAELRNEGYGQPQVATTPAAAVTPPVATTPPVAGGLPPAPGAQAGLPPINVAPPAPTKIDFPDVSSEEDMDENAITQTAAALAFTYGNDALKKLLALFQVPEGGSAKDIQAGYRYIFWQYATNEAGLRQQSVIS